MKPMNQISKIVLVGMLAASSAVALSACNKTSNTETSSETTTETAASPSLQANTPMPIAIAPKPEVAKTDLSKADLSKAELSKSDISFGDATKTDATKTDATTAAVPETATQNNLVDLAVANGDFKTLTAALEAAGLTDTLKGDGPFTLFAPTDEAFAALPAGTLDELLKPENKDKLIKVLTYHVVAQQVASKDITPGEVKTVEGEALTVEVDSASSEVRVNDAKVTKPDIQATNGVIHVVDKVILPPDVQITPAN